MKYGKRGRKIDANHISVANAFIKCGCSVADLSAVGGSVCDLLVGNGKENILVEVKMPGSNIYKSQVEFLANWKGLCAFVSTEEEAAKIAREPHKYCLTEKQKIKLIGFVLRWESKDEKPKMNVELFDKRIKELFA